MPKQTSPHDQPNDPWPDEAGSKAPAGGPRDVGSKTSDRPERGERANEERVPPRGDRKGDAHA